MQQGSQLHNTRRLHENDKHWQQTISAWYKIINQYIYIHDCTTPCWRLPLFKLY